MDCVIGGLLARLAQRFYPQELEGGCISAISFKEETYE
jgi:hypothetical protein